MYVINLLFACTIFVCDWLPAKTFTIIVIRASMLERSSSTSSTKYTDDEYNIIADTSFCDGFSLMIVLWPQHRQSWILAVSNSEFFSACILITILALLMTGYKSDP